MSDAPRLRAIGDAPPPDAAALYTDIRLACERAADDFELFAYSDDKARAKMAAILGVDPEGVTVERTGGVLAFSVYYPGRVQVEIKAEARHP